MHVSVFFAWLSQRIEILISYLLTPYKGFCFLRKILNGSSCFCSYSFIWRKCDKTSYFILNNIFVLSASHATQRKVAVTVTNSPYPFSFEINLWNEPLIHYYLSSYCPVAHRNDTRSIHLCLSITIDIFSIFLSRSFQSSLFFTL